MGLYINPKTETKEEFLAREGKQISEQEMMIHDFNEDEFLCCLVDNGFFTAAIICYCEKELDYIKSTRETDMRPIKFYLVDSAKVQEFL